MDFVYVLCSDIVTDEDNNKYTVYGITAINYNNQILDSIPDIFFDKEKAEEFIELCNCEKVELIHLQDLAEDQLF